MSKNFLLGKEEPFIPSFGGDYEGDVRRRDLKIKSRNGKTPVFLYTDGEKVFDTESGREILPSEIDFDKNVYFVMGSRQKKRLPKEFSPERIRDFGEWANVSEKEIYLSVFKGRERNEILSAITDAKRRLEEKLSLKFFYGSMGKYVRTVVERKTKRRFGERKRREDLICSFAPSYGFSEAFLTKSGKGRKIRVYDLNSAFPHALTLPIFPHPSHLKRYVGSVDPKETGGGCFLTEITISGDFLRDYAPLYARMGGASVPIRWEEGEKVKVWLPKPEAEFYSGITETKIMEGVVSDRTVSSGLEKFVEYLYSLRLESDDPLFKRVVKNHLVYLHASYLKYEKTIVSGKRGEEIVKEEGYYPDWIYPDMKPLSSFRERRWKLKRLSPEFSDVSFFKTVVSHVRRRVSETALTAMECGLEIAYANVDSLHLVGDGEDFERFERRINLHPTRLGSWKLECEADDGAWFSPGFYYLAKEGRLVKSASPVASEEKRKKNPFQSFTKRYVESIDDFFVMNLLSGRFMNKVADGNRWRRIEGDRERREPIKFLMRSESENSLQVGKIFREFKAKYS